MTDLDLPSIHEQVLQATGRIVGDIGAEQWDRPTPCDEWTVRQLTNHVVAGNLWAAELAAGRTIAEVGERFDGDVLGDDPVAAYVDSANAANDAFAAPGAMDEPCAVSYGPVPGSLYCGHRIIDVLIHGWDLAKATGQPTELDPGLVEACWTIAEPQASILAGSGMFGDGVDVAADADRQTQLLAMLGRRP